MTPLELASISANLEDDFYKYAEKDAGYQFDVTFSIPDTQGNYTDKQTHTFTVAAVMEYDTEKTMINTEGQTVKVGGPKVIIFEDDQGNVFAHFNGTGDGKWGQNATNYGGPPSEVQTDSLAFFDQFMAENYEGRLNKGNVYVSGHSQGGNTAQYVTMQSRYGDYIDMCMDMDGPKFSQDAVDRFRNAYGEAHYEQQRQKIYAVHGEIDFVSPLGQVEIVPEGHTLFVENTGGNPHSIEGMMDGSNLNVLRTEDAPLRQFVTGFNHFAQEKLSEEEQQEIAGLVMKTAESLLGHGNENLREPLTQQELDRIKELALPLLVEYIHENPGMVDALVDDFVKRGVLDEDMGDLIKTFVTEFNALPQDQRQDAIDALAKSVVVREDGTIGFDADVSSLFFTLASIGPSVIASGAREPEAVQGMLEKFGVWEKIVEKIAEHPVWATVIATAVVVLWKPLKAAAAVVAVAATVISGAINLFYSVVETLEQFGQAVKNFVLNTLAAIKDAVQKAKSFLRSLTPGVGYAAQHPYFKADSTLLRGYADQLALINQRLSTLDSNLNSLYWQVGFLDLLDILAMNIIAGYSPRLYAAEQYLNYAADTLEAADNTAMGYMGG